MTRKNIILFNAVLVGLLYMNFYGCRHTPVTPPVSNVPIDTFKSGPCDTTLVYFQQQILPIFISNCDKSGCHDAQHEEAPDFTSYSSIISSGAVSAINPQRSAVYRAISTTTGEDIMPPPPNSPLTSRQISLILKWMQQGAKNLSCTGICDTVNVRFSANINVIIQNYCLGCHSGSNPSKGILLTSYSNVYATVQNGQLTGAVTGAPGYILMPYNSGKLPDCYITQIKKWIANGAPNN